MDLGRLQVIGHDTVGKHPAARKIFLHPHEHPEMLTLRILENKPPVGRTERRGDGGVSSLTLD